MTTLSCELARSQFSDYLDGMTSGANMQSVAAHLNTCENCADEFLALRNIQRLLSEIRPVQPPRDLGLRLRVAISQERARTARRRLDLWQMHWQNSLAPFLARAAAGFATAVVLLGILGLMVGTVAAPPPVAASDVIAENVSTPRFLYAAIGADQGIVFPKPILVEAQISSSGRIYSYRIVSGPESEAVRQNLDNLLLLSHFSPARFYGIPIPGRAILSFSGVSVHG